MSVKSRAGGAAQGAMQGAALGSIVPGIGTAVGAIGGGLLGGLFGGGDDDAAMEELRKNQELYGNIATPQFEDYNPKMYEYSGDLTPEDAKYQTVSEDPRLKSAQSSYLAKLAGLSDQGLSAEDALGFAKAQNDAAQVAHSGNAAALQNAQARGQAGSGLEFLMHEQAGQDAASRAQMGGLETAAAAARQRALYNQAYGGAAAGLRDQDFRAANTNADIINRFNEANTQTHNAAQLRNLNARQTVGNARADQNNSAVQYRNSLKQQGFADQIQKAGGQAGANTGMAGGYAAKDAAGQSGQNTMTGIAGQILVNKYGKQSDGVAPQNQGSQASGTKPGLGVDTSVKSNPFGEYFT